MKTTNDLVKQLKSNESGLRFGDMLQSGGEWLGAARSWIQWNCGNGCEVDWGSEAFITNKPLTVGDIERFAADVAAATLREFKEHLVTEGEARAIKEYKNRQNWRSPREDDRSRRDLGLCVFDPNKDNMHFAMSFMHENGWDLAECVDEPEVAKKRKFK